MRKLVAVALARQIELCRELGAVPGLKAAALVRRQLWARPHDRRFDFRATAAGAAWIDGLGDEAHLRLEAAPADIAGHNDWRVEHLRFRDGQLSATWDWDSLSVGAEPVFVGSAAHGFVADWNVDGLDCVPTLDESRAFVADYEEARGAAFSPAERRLADAGLVAAMAYSARCEHADELSDWGTRPPGPASDSVPAGFFRAFLAEHGSGLLGVSGIRVPPIVKE